MSERKRLFQFDTSSDTVTATVRRRTPCQHDSVGLLALRLSRPPISPCYLCVVVELLPSEKFESNFSEEIRSSGSLLHAVRNWGAFDRIACLFPEDNDTECTLELKGRFLVPSCSCADFAQGRLCKHLWAALLTADRFEDLGKSLQKNVPRIIQLPKQMPSQEEGPSYEPVEKRRKAKSTLQRQMDGVLLDYEPMVLRKSKPAPSSLRQPCLREVAISGAGFVIIPHSF